MYTCLEPKTKSKKLGVLMEELKLTFQTLLKQKAYAVEGEIKRSEHSFFCNVKKLNNHDSQIFRCKIFPVPKKTKAKIKSYFPPAKNLKYSANIIDIILLKDNKKAKYIAVISDYIQGCSPFMLFDALGRNFLDEHEISAIMLFTLFALQELHKKKIVHRDLKVENIILTPNGEIKLTDAYIIGKLNDSNIIPSLTNETMPPEYYTNKEKSNKEYLDIWSLGIIMIELLEGDHRFFDNPLIQTSYGAAQMEPNPEGVSAFFSEFVKSVCILDPKKRPNIDKILNEPFMKFLSPEQAKGIIVFLVKKYFDRLNDLQEDTAIKVMDIPSESSLETDSSSTEVTS